MSTATRRKLVDLPERGVRLSVADFGGSGPPLLLSHANGFCAGVYEPLVAGLRAGHRVLGFDARGHGDSSAPPPPAAYAWEEFVRDLIALLDALAPELGHQPVYGVGHSFGGTVTLCAASRRPDLFTRVALLDPVIHPVMPDGLPVRPPPGMGDMARKRRAIWPSRRAARDSWSGRLPFSAWAPGVLDLYLTHGMRDRPDGRIELKCAPEVEAAVYEQSGLLDPVASARSLSRPGILLFARQGNFPRTFFSSVAEAAPDLRVVEVDAGHLLPMEIPEEVAERLLHF